jgi:hypothetical protein
MKKLRKKKSLCGKIYFLLTCPLKLIRVVWSLAWGFGFLFCGFRPIPILENIKYSFSGKLSNDRLYDEFEESRLMMYENYDVDIRYRLWNIEAKGFLLKNPTYIPITPLEFCVVVGFPILLPYLPDIFITNGEYLSIGFFMTIMAVIVGGLIFYFILHFLLKRIGILKSQ